MLLVKVLPFINEVDGHYCRVALVNAIGFYGLLNKEADRSFSHSPLYKEI